MVTLVLCLFALLADGRNPGFKARLTSRGLNYGKLVWQTGTDPEGETEGPDPLPTLPPMENHKWL